MWNPVLFTSVVLAVLGERHENHVGQEERL